MYFVKKSDPTKVHRVGMKRKTRQGKTNEALSLLKKLEEDSDVIAILDAPSSHDWYEEKVKKMKRKKIPLTKRDALENWKSLWKQTGTTKTYY